MSGAAAGQALVDAAIEQQVANNAFQAYKSDERNADQIAKEYAERMAFQAYRAGEQNADQIAADYEQRMGVQEYKDGERQGYEQENKTIQPFIPWLVPISFEKDVDIPLIKNLPILPHFINIGYTLGVEFQTLANMPTHLSNNGMIFKLGQLELSAASDSNSFGVGVSFPNPFQNQNDPVQTSTMASATVNLDGWDSTFRYTADVLVAAETSRSYSQGLYVEWKPIKVAVISAGLVAIAIIIFTPVDEVVAIGTGLVLAISETFKQLIPILLPNVGK